MKKMLSKTKEMIPSNVLVGYEPSGYKPSG